MSEEQIVPAGAEYVTGRIKWFNNQKAFGFIELPEGGLDVFVHANQLRKSGIDRALVEGDQVKFVTSKGPKGNFATNISLILAVDPAEGKINGV